MCEYTPKLHIKGTAHSSAGRGKKAFQQVQHVICTPCFCIYWFQWRVCSWTEVGLITKDNVSCSLRHHFPCPDILELCFANCCVANTIPIS